MTVFQGNITVKQFVIEKFPTPEKIVSFLKYSEKIKILIKFLFSGSFSKLFQIEIINFIKKRCIEAIRYSLRSQFRAPIEMRETEKIFTPEFHKQMIKIILIDVIVIKLTASLYLNVSAKKIYHPESNIQQVFI